MLLGSIVNAAVIIVCALTGTFLVRGIPQRIDEIIKKAIGLSVFFLGVKGAINNQNFLLLLISLVFGGALGELINIDGFMNRLGLWAEKKLGKIGNAGGGGDRSFSKGFVNASILYCTGSMAILGALQSGLSGNHEMLYAKSAIDGITSLIFGASMGLGVAFSAVPVFLYQSGVTFLSVAASNFLTEDMIREMAAVGSLVIAAIGLNFLEMTKIRVANFIPAIFMPIVYIVIENLF